jgi:hypothetical protein
MAHGVRLRSFGAWELVLQDLASGEQVYVNKETHEVQEDPPAEVAKILQAESRQPVYEPTPHRFALQLQGRVSPSGPKRGEAEDAPELCVACGGLGHIALYGGCPLCDGRGSFPAETELPTPTLRVEREALLGPEYERGGGAAFVLRSLLSPAECEEIIAQAESFGLRDCGYHSRIRVNDRVLVMGELLAEALFRRARPYLTDIRVRMGEVPTPRGVPPDVPKGRWSPVGLNPCFRVCKYTPGGFFLPHHDHGFTPAEDHRSLKTFMIYLNDGFDGGATTFFRESQSHYSRPDSGRVIQALKLQRGSCLVFNHCITHDGGKLLAGEKYILRTEVMYRHHRK